VTEDSSDFLAGLSVEKAMPALLAGAFVTSPYWLALLAGKRRRRRKRFAFRYGRRGVEKSPDISPDWLALLTGSQISCSCCYY
jgi:O-antigen/teichoic acid export membrane protein